MVLKGSQLPGFDGVAINQLFAYALQGGHWVQVPIQVDEVDAGGTFRVEDGILDGNDEIVFMAKDGGILADQSVWIEDDDSKQVPRYEIQITNPLSPSELNYIYIYSSTLPATYDNYVDWDSTATALRSDVYSMSLTTDSFIGIESISLNGSDVDILDRSKFGASVKCIIIPIVLEINMPLTEEDPLLTALVDDLEPSVIGPVRVGISEPDISIWAYESFFQAQLDLDISSIDLEDICFFGFSINWARLSFDLLNPIETGFGTPMYFDNLFTSGVVIDGTPDPEIGTNPVIWTQISGNYGSAVQLRDVSVTSGDIQNYYLDNATYEDEDTGDHLSFGNSGVFIDNPEGIVTVDLHQIFLDPNLGPVGETYLAYKENPLAVAVAEQWYVERYPVFIPLILSSNP